MADEINITVPDIGGATQVDVIEVMVKPGDEVEKETPLVTLESDKASMEIPSPEAGKVKAVALKVGDKVSEGSLIVTLEAKTTSPDRETPKLEEAALASASKVAAAPVNEAEDKPKQEVAAQSLPVCIPDIGGASDVEVIELLVAPGDSIKKDQSLITLEGDKATMDIPSPADGVVESLAVKVGDKVSQGYPVLILKTEPSKMPLKEAAPSLPEQTAPQIPAAPTQTKAPEIMQGIENGTPFFGSPAVRRMARELGVNLAEVKGSGRKSRITKEDIQQYVKTRLSEKQTASGFSLPSMPVIDFSKFGEVQSKPLNKIKRLTGVNVHRSWITIPHVTQFDEADITDLEAFRKSEAENSAQAGYKLTILAFVTKVVAKALSVYPQFNASLDATGENLIYKHYYNVGIAVETPNGLVVPVIKEVDRLSLGDIALEMARLSNKARDKGLMPADMSGGCFTISSLGGIGGTAFTPIVNSPEVAILGLSRTSIKPVFTDDVFKPRLMLPLSLSYDHRVIDGAEAARFTRFISDSLSDIRRIIL
ncbi:MAG: dihydrolipoyllysine-residue acetyltransferase [Tatlockia sp.]|jgi:pyruvate dehydrogenase E2 component (dihydrolipoamide acetyltransferase)